MISFSPYKKVSKRYFKQITYYFLNQTANSNFQDYFGKEVFLHKLIWS
jgi:hypothetical protein